MPFVLLITQHLVFLLHNWCLVEICYWDRIKHQKQRRINKSNKRENNKRIHHVYKPGEMVTLERGGINPKLSYPRQGPYRVVQAYENGTVTIQKALFVMDCFNIRRIRPYYGVDNKG